MKSLIAVFTCVVLAGCATPNKAYQPAGQAKVGPSNLYSDNTTFPKLCAIEFDEQGDLWNARQYSSAKNYLRTGKRPLLVVFIHGWHNNAHPENGNLQSFNQLLKQLSKRADFRDMEVTGVYIGWRGLAIERQWDKTGIGWLARNMTFYSRKADTDLVAGIPLTNTLYSLARDAHARDGRVIFIGHSFGGRVLEKAIAQAIVGQRAGESESTVPADLTLLLNPASEAITARRLKLALANWKQSTPAVISVTSTGDTDTSTLWSIGMKLSLFTKSKSYRSYGDGSHQQEYIVSTAGNSPILLDRKIVSLEPQPAAPTEDATKWNFQHASLDQFRAADTWWRIKDIPTSSGPFVMNGDQARGYWVMSAPKEIIRDHNDIFNPAAIDLFAALFKISEPTIRKTPEQKAIAVPATIAETAPPDTLISQR